MARRIFGGRSRANTTIQISNPTLAFSDAIPRDDLQTLGQLSVASPPSTEVEQPKTSGGRSTKQELQDYATAFDFRVTEPPEKAVRSDSFARQRMMDNPMIGIALGSPGVVASPYPASKLNEGPFLNETYDPATGMTGLLRRKPSKWKKLGGLFKGKQNTAKSSSDPFYQVQINNQPLHNSAEHVPDQTFSTQARYGSPHGIARRDKEGDPTEAWPRFEDVVQSNENHLRQGPDSEIFSAADSQGPLLRIDIPDVQMERYSVMFGSVLGNKQPAGLLARRSRTLDKLKVDVEQHSIEALKPQRRATSPVPSKSSFTLFPSAPLRNLSKSPNFLVVPTARSPRRSNTLPVELTQHQTFLRVPHATSPVPSTNSSQGQWPLLSASSYDGRSVEVEEVALLKRVPTKSYVNTREEPAWEMITIDKRVESPETMNMSPPSNESTPATTPEEPPTTPPKDFSLVRSRQIRSIAATRDRVDLIMSSGGSGPATGKEKASRPTLPSAPKPKNRTQLTPPPEKESDLTAQNGMDLEVPSSSTEEIQTPKIEVSVARSVSLSRGPRQTLVPLGARPDHFKTDERYVERQPQVPTVVDVRRGHRPGRSQNVLIETA